jgi:hypothetical protein
VTFLCGPNGIASGYELNIIPSWGDQVWVHGPGTDAAMDSPETMENMIKHYKGRGFTGLYLRTDLAQVQPFIYYHDLGKLTPHGAIYRKILDDMMAEFDVHVTAQKFCDKYGMKYWTWHPHLYSDGAPKEFGGPGPGRIWPWSYCAKYTFDNPEVITIDRQGNPYWMVREYAYPGSRSSKVDEFVYMAKHFGLKRFIPCMRSEATQIQPPPDKADRFGFNAPVVNDMKTLFGVDIMTDSRFDVDSPNFDPQDPMVENWRNLRGTYITQFYRELRERLNEVDQNIQIAATLSGDHVGPIVGNIRLDWRTWVDEGLVDEIITPTTVEATMDLDSASKDYLTDVRGNKGVVPFLEMKDYIKNSKHPEIKIISTNTLPPWISPYDYSSPPDGTDGWRIDAWYDSYTLAWFQRWRQWKKDLRDFGHIKFFEQNFDGFPVNSSGYSGGWGDERYYPELRICPGLWFTLGDGSDAKPTAQDVVAHGPSGNAIKLTCSNEDTSFTGWHSSAPDRSNMTNCLDNAITNGSGFFEYWIYRDSDDSSLTVYFHSRTGDEKRDVGLKLSGQTGNVAYSDDGKWIDTDYYAPIQKWHKYTIKVDCEGKTYSAYAGENDKTMLCANISYSIPKTRFTALNGVNVPIPVPVYRSFDTLTFNPEGKTGSVTYLDDISVKWIPELHFSEPGENVTFADDFEAHAIDTGVDGEWKVSPEKSDFCFITNDTSFGDGVKCLRAKGGADIIAGGEKKLRLDSGDTITLEFDIFIRSDKDYPYIIPDPTTTSKHRATISLEQDGTTSLAGVYAGDGTWQYWDGSGYVDSKVRIEYDVWNHLQMALDTSKNSCKIVVQPLGEMPTLMTITKYEAKPNVLGQYRLRIITSDTEGHMSCYDNICITRSRAKKVNSRGI